MIKSLFLLVFCIASSIAYGQSEGENHRKNALKINILPPLLSATSEVSYERFLRPNLSIVAGIGANLRGNQSDFVLSSDADLSFLNRDIQNRYFLAEVRRYIGFCDCGLVSPHGFYAGGFVRYNRVDFSSDLQFGSSSTHLNTRIETNFRSLNFGGLVGYQIKRNNWLIDFEFGGLGYAPNWIQFNADSALSNDELAQVSDALSQNFGIRRNFREIELNSSEAEINFWYWTFRYAVSIGYNF
ncbi:hypothetical protein SAMN05192553_101120 [Cyclobacterium xiamenense]|uniref:DUF3575 domain-containing protein n=2 Tax=Cyclobacterium xiamenense TaxID=1297121 RepID=A0A1H6T5P4_9BACT|nr:hypothetical protein SAMN05192553_101120 [Cyclobacterium xiamenense]